MLWDDLRKTSVCVAARPSDAARILPRLVHVKLPSKLRGRTAREAAVADLACMYMGSTLVTPLYVLYEREFGFSELTLTLIFAAYSAGNIASLFVLGRISD